MLFIERLCFFLIFSNAAAVDGVTRNDKSTVFNSFFAGIFKYFLQCENNIVTLYAKVVQKILSDKNNFMTLVERHKIGRNHKYHVGSSNSNNNISRDNCIGNDGSHP